MHQRQSVWVSHVRPFPAPAAPGACDGSLACSTCHLILTQETYDSLPEPCEEELDMLDLAFDLTDTSRLGCQIKVTKGLEGMVATVPGPPN
jgi:ferredoxin-2, mitochondrial